MSPVLIFSTLNAAMELVSVLLPQLHDMVGRGLITPEQQAETLEKYKALKIQAESPFSGPEWKVE